MSTFWRDTEAQVFRRFRTQVAEVEGLVTEYGQLPALKRDAGTTAWARIDVQPSDRRQVQNEGSVKRYRMLGNLQIQLFVRRGGDESAAVLANLQDAVTNAFIGATEDGIRYGVPYPTFKGADPADDSWSQVNMLCPLEVDEVR